MLKKIAMFASAGILVCALASCGAQTKQISVPTSSASTWSVEKTESVSETQRFAEYNAASSTTAISEKLPEKTTAVCSAPKPITWKEAAIEAIVDFRNFFDQNKTEESGNWDTKYPGYAFSLEDLNQDGVPDILLHWSEYEIGGIAAIALWDGSGYHVLQNEVDYLTGFEIYRNTETGVIEYWGIDEIFEGEEEPMVGHTPEYIRRFELTDSKITLAESYDYVKNYMDYEQRALRPENWEIYASWFSAFSRTHEKLNVREELLRDEDYFYFYDLSHITRSKVTDFVMPY